MNTALIVAVIVVVAIVAVGYWWYSQQRRREELRGRFGSEYDRTVREQGGQGAAERELARRQQRVQALDIRPLSAQERDTFDSEWRMVQAQFVDDPPGAIRDADRLVGQVMQTRGYPVGDFEQRAADVSVDHPQVVENYREAHRIAESDGQASTESLRTAMVHYRSLFQDLLSSDERAGVGPADRQ